jgi:hypothetical protein
MSMMNGEKLEGEVFYTNDSQLLVAKYVNETIIESIIHVNNFTQKTL